MIKAPSKKPNHEMIFENWRDFVQSEEVEPTAWLQMVKENYEAILAEDPLNEDLLKEGAWSKIKYYMGKMGSLEKGGKMFGRGKRSKEALEKLDAAIEQAAKQGFGQFKATIDQTYPEFPNMEDHEQFLTALMDIGAVYDSLEAAVNKYNQNAQAKDGLDPDSANAVVEALRQYVQWLLDYQLADSYKHFKENKEIHEQDGITASPQDPNAPQGTFTRRGAEGEEVDSETMKGLRSNLLPILLGLSGASGVLVGILLKGAWLPKMLGIVKSGNPATVIRAFKLIKTVLSVKKGYGISQLVGDAAAGDAATFAPGVPASQFLEQAQNLGIDISDPSVVADNLAMNGSGFEASWAKGVEMVSQNPNATMAEAFPASDRALWLKEDAMAEVSQAVAAPAATVGGGAAAVTAGKMAAASTLATTLGIGLLAAGAAVKLIRIKGMKSSRAQMLKDLSIELQPFEGAKLEDPGPGETPPGPGPGPGTPEDDEEEQRYTVPLYGKSGDTVEAYIRKWARDQRRKGVNVGRISGKGLEEFLEVIEKWMSDVEKTYKDDQYLNLREQPDDSPENAEGQAPKRTIYVSKNRTRSMRGKSLMRRLYNLLRTGAGTGGQAGMSPFTRSFPADEKGRKLASNLARGIAKFVMQDLESQGAPIQQEESLSISSSRLSEIITEELSRFNEKPAPRSTKMKITIKGITK